MCKKNKWEEKTWFCHLLGKGTVVRITQWSRSLYKGAIKYIMDWTAYWKYIAEYAGAKAFFTFVMPTRGVWQTLLLKRQILKPSFFLPLFLHIFTRSPQKTFFKLPGIWRFHKIFGLFVECKARVSSDNYVKALNFDRERRKLSNRIIISVILIILMHNSGTQCRIFYIFWSI